MKLLLTGATGFVGRHVLAKLQQHAIPLRVVVRAGRHNLLPSTQLEIIEVDDLFTQSVAWWQANAQGVTHVLHVAWYAEPRIYLQSPKNLDCLIGTLMMAKGCALAGVTRFVGVGTCFEYDTSQGRLSIDTPLKPDSPYAAAKVAAYWALQAFFSQASIAFAWCRLFYLYGEAGDGEDVRRLVPYVRHKLAQGLPVQLTHGQQVRDYLNVQEAAQELIDVLLGGKTGAINVCSGQAITVRALVEKIADEFGRRDLLHFGAQAMHSTDPPVIVGVKNT